MQASSVAAVHEATALVDAATQLDSPVATSVQRQMAAVTAITSTSPSVAVSLVDAEHTATALVNVVSQPQELNSSVATLPASKAKQDVGERYTIRWNHMANDPFATIHAELAALRRTVDELRRAAVAVTAVNTEDRDAPYCTEQPTVKQARKPPPGSCTERRDGVETSGDKTRALTGLLGEMMEVYRNLSCGILDDDVRGGTSRDDRHISRPDQRSGCSMEIQGHRHNSKHRREKESREGVVVKRFRCSPAATTKRGRTNDVVHALVTRRSEPNRIVDQRSEDSSYTANRRDRRYHEDAINDIADAPDSRRPRSNRLTNPRDDRNLTAMHLRDDDELEMRRDREFSVHRQDGGPYRRYAHTRSDYRHRY